MRVRLVVMSQCVREFKGEGVRGGELLLGIRGRFMS